MVKKELIEKSPLRSLEKATSGGLGKGNIAILASKKGLGKTACLVHIATDKLLRERHVIHVSFSSRVDHIMSWYEDIFSEVSKLRDLSNAMEVHDELIKNRVVMNFSLDMSIDHVLDSLKAMIENGLENTDAIIVDGYDFSSVKANDIAKIKDFASDKDVEIWMSDSYVNEPFVDENGIPTNLKPVLDTVAVILTMKAQADHMELHLVKDHDNLVADKDLKLKLDPKTLLISEV